LGSVAPFATRQRVGATSPPHSKSFRMFSHLHTPKQNAAGLLGRGGAPCLGSEEDYLFFAFLALVFFAEAFIVDFFFAIFSTSPESGIVRFCGDSLICKCALTNYIPPTVSPVM